MFDRKANYYFKRTVEHIHKVQNNALILVTKYADKLQLTKEDCRGLMWNVFKHDQSKFSIEQFEPYIELTEFYFQRKTMGCKDYKYPKGVETQVDKAVDNHYRTENHHPERFINPKGGLLWGKYSQLESIETVCDLQAMAQEFNEGSCLKFWEEKWLPKHMHLIPCDWNWEEVQVWMKQAINCFEQEIEEKRTKPTLPVTGICP